MERKKVLMSQKRQRIPNRFRALFKKEHLISNSWLRYFCLRLLLDIFPVPLREMKIVFILLLKKLNFSWSIFYFSQSNNWSQLSNITQRCWLAKCSAISSMVWFECGSKLNFYRSLASTWIIEVARSQTINFIPSLNFWWLSRSVARWKAILTIVVFPVPEGPVICRKFFSRANKNCIIL